MSRLTQLILWLVAITAVLLAWWSLFGKDENAPQLQSEWYFAEEKLTPNNSYELPSEQNIQLQLNSNEPIELHLNYGKYHQQTTGRWHRFTIPVQAGSQSVMIEAHDRAGNVSILEQPIIGIPLLDPLVKLPETIQPGEPFVLQLNTPSQLYGITLPNSVNAQLNNKPLSIFQAGESIIALGALPLTDEETLPLPDAELVLTIQDKFGRISQVRKNIIVVPNNIRLETLSLSQDLMNLRSEANLFYEVQLLEEAYARVNLLAPLWTEPFIQPIQGTTSSGYGIPRRYGVGGNIGFHRGTDMAAAAGTPIAATNDGIVVIAAQDYPIRGNFTMIAHGADVYSLYFHQKDIYVREGTQVARGDIIGTVGSTGLSTGAHLHWEMHIGNTETKPELWIDTLLPGLDL